MYASQIVKTPSIIDSFYVDFVNQLGEGETIESASVTAFNAYTFQDQTAILIVTSPAPAIVETQVQFSYQGGVVGQRYVISVKVVTSTGRNLEGDVNVLVVPSYDLGRRAGIAV